MKKILSLLFFIFSLFTVYSQQTVGLFTYEPGSYNGYTLFAPIPNTETYLIDNCGKYIHSWTSTYRPGLSVYLLEDGTLLRTGKIFNNNFTGGGMGGIIERFDWEGNLTWSYQISDEFELQHHDIEFLPNGNILAIVWEKKTDAEAIAEGRNPENTGIGIWPDKIIEIEPVGTNEGNIVWEWHAWDHLVQDFDALANNYGVISESPELINLNYITGHPQGEDWLHFNGIDYNPEFDQILISVHNFHEVWVIDHSTTTSEAASHSGGTYGVGGDLLYRWGNPFAYDRGLIDDQIFFNQHDARWIEYGDDTGKIMVFNNGTDRPDGDYSTVDVFNPPVDVDGFYTLNTGQAFEPAALDWEYSDPTDFYSTTISGAERLPNGNTLICEGNDGRFFEIDNDGNIFWEYINPISTDGPVEQETEVGGAGPGSIPVRTFRCKRYNPEYSAFDGRTLIPGEPLELNPYPYECEIYSGIDDKINKFGFDIYPNPTSDFVNIKLNERTNFAIIEIFNTAGQLVFKKNMKLQENTELDLRSLNRGIFFINITTDKEALTKKLVIQ